MHTISNPHLSDGRFGAKTFFSQLSVFSNCRTATPVGSASLEHILFGQPQTAEYVRHIRTLPPEQFKAAKSALWAFTPAGVFAQRSKSGLLQHSGFVAVDIDHCAVEAVKSSLAQCQYIYYAGLSCSGRGVWALVRVEDGAAHHTEYCRGIMDCLREWYGIDCDKSCTDVCRLRYASWDEAPVYNPGSTVWTYLPPKAAAPAYHCPVQSEDGQRSAALRVIDYVVGQRFDITRRRSDWICLGACLRSNFGDDGEGLFVALSQFYDGFSPEECRRQYRTFATQGYGLGNLFRIAGNYGIQARGLF